MIRIEVSPTAEETKGWSMEDWQRLANDFIREFDAVDLSAKSKRKSAKATNLKDSQYVVALHRDSKSGIMHLHIDAAATIAAQSGGGGGGATSGWGRDKDEDELSWAYRCAMMANRLCRPRKKQGYGR